VAASFLDAYLRRIELALPARRDLAALSALHAAHVNAIPFENLDILLGRDIRIDLGHVVAKLIGARRGGYCFEQNTLFLAVLRELGIAAIPMEARVRAGTATTLPRTHMVLRVDVDGQRWLADVGFGAEGPSGPVPMNGEVTTLAAGLAYRVVDEGDLRVLQMRRDGVWTDQYAFLEAPVYPVDFEMANWFTSTFPKSPFVQKLTVQRTTPLVRHILRYPIYTQISAAGTQTRDIARSELIPILRDVFALELAEDTVFPAIDGQAAAERT
jgi:N-hydroxyarylamine O-acetyltransferase